MVYLIRGGGAVHRELVLEKSYYGNESYYEKYDDMYEGNYVINVDRIKDIPKDYYGLMGVPVTIAKYLYESDFKIVNKKHKEGYHKGLAVPIIRGKEKYARLLIQRKKKDEQ